MFKFFLYCFFEILINIDWTFSVGVNNWLILIETQKSLLHTPTRQWPTPLQKCWLLSQLWSVVVWLWCSCLVGVTGDGRSLSNLMYRWPVINTLSVDAGQTTSLNHSQNWKFLKRRDIIINQSQDNTSYPSNIQSTSSHSWDMPYHSWDIELDSYLIRRDRHIRQENGSSHSWDMP